MTTAPERTNGAADLAWLHARIAELEGELVASRGREHLLRELLNNIPSAIYLAGRDGTLQIVNTVFAAQWGRSPASLEGRSLRELFPPETAAEWEVRIASVASAREPIAALESYGQPGAERHYDNLRFPVAGPDGQPFGMGGVSTDVTDLHTTEHERATLQEQLIASQQAALRELSTPLIPIVAGVVIMPLIGSIDSARATLVMETLLEGVSAHRARVVILDITGLPLVDSQVANVLLQAAQAARLLGAEVLLTGIRPEVAQTLVGIGADLSGLTTPGTLQDGVAMALHRTGRGG